MKRPIMAGSPTVDLESQLTSASPDDAMLLDADVDKKAGGALCRPLPLGQPQDVPPECRVDFVLTGYRVDLTVQQCFASIFRLHNETFNIWTHLAGCFLFIALWPSAVSVPVFDKSGTAVDETALTLYLTAAILCTGWSAIFHTFGCLTGGWYERLYKLDISGICLLIGASFFVGIRVGFYCMPILQVVYLFITFVCIGLIFLTTICNFLSSPKWASLRVGLLVGVVVFGIVPAIHWVIITDKAVMLQYSPQLFGMFVAYGIGFAFWKSKFPERMAPGKFDVWFVSHQWWHVFVVVAAWIWYNGLSGYMVWRLETPCPA